MSEIVEKDLPRDLRAWAQNSTDAVAVDMRAAADALTRLFVAIAPLVAMAERIEQDCPGAPDNDETGVSIGVLRAVARAVK